MAVSDDSLDDLPICVIGSISSAGDSAINWLIESLWLKEAAGLIGGQPKTCKSWLGLDAAVSVASGTPCLGRYAIKERGPALVFLAEDGLDAVHSRVEGICRSRELEIGSLDLHVITSPLLRLDDGDDRARLCRSLERIRPRLLLLDPLVRLHRLDENNARDIAGLLGFLREIQRRFATAVMLTHHANKRVHSRPGQGLRGSSDLHAFGDSNLYLSRQGEEEIHLSVEHRSAPAVASIRLILDSNDPVHLTVFSGEEKIREVNNQESLEQRIVRHIKQRDGAVRRSSLREELRVNNQRLGLALTTLLASGRAVATSAGITLSSTRQPDETESGSAGMQPDKG